VALADEVARGVKGVGREAGPGGGAAGQRRGDGFFTKGNSFMLRLRLCGHSLTVCKHSMQRLPQAAGTRAPPDSRR
jgi:hypothetical protein